MQLSNGEILPEVSISSKPYKTASARLLYNLSSSTNPVERGVAKSILNIARVMGAKERTEKLKKEASNKEREELLIFLQGDVTVKKLKDIGINPNLFKISVLKTYLYGLEDTLAHLISSFGKLIKGVKKEKPRTIDMKNIDFITRRMINPDFDLRNTDFVKQEDEDLDTIERRFSKSLKTQQVGASSKIVKKYKTELSKKKTKKVLSKKKVIKKKKKVSKKKLSKKKVPKKLKK